MSKKKILVKMFNKHYINIVKETKGIAPKNLGNPSQLKEKTIREIIEKNRKHLSIIKTKKIVKENPLPTFWRPPQKI